VLPRVVLDETLAVLCQGAGHFGRSTRAGTIDEALGAPVGKTVHPLSQSGRGERERVGDGLPAVPFDHCTDGWGTAEDPRLFRLCQESVSSRQGIIGKVQFAGPHVESLHNKVRVPT